MCAYLGPAAHSPDVRVRQRWDEMDDPKNARLTRCAADIGRSGCFFLTGPPVREIFGFVLDILLALALLYIFVSFDRACLLAVQV
jgi:hypothetical protein